MTDPVATVRGPRRARGPFAASPAASDAAPGLDPPSSPSSPDPRARRGTTRARGGAARARNTPAAAGHGAASAAPTWSPARSAGL